MTADQPQKISNLILHSVQARLLLSFGAVILTSLVLVGSVLFMYLRVVQQYESVTNLLVLENRFAVKIPQLIEAYYENVSSGYQSAGRLAVYNQLHKDIADTLRQLDATIADPTSRTAYQNLRSFTLNVLQECDRGMALMSKGDTAGAVVVYNKSIAPIRPFVYENTSKLTASELTVAERMQEQVLATRRLLLWLTLVMFLLVAVANAFLVRGASNSVSRPLHDLTVLAQRISGGNLAAAPSAEFLSRQDEIGSLANSLNEMLQRLRQELDVQRSANAELSKIGQELESKNSDLARINKYMVDRELKMIQLKDRITELETKLTQLGKA